MSDMVDNASVPATYALLILDLTHERGVDRATMLRDLGITEATLARPDGRLSLRQVARLTMRALNRTQDPAMGYEIGLRSNLGSHGFVGYGLLSLPTFREALDFGARFVRLRTPFIGLRYFEEAGQCVIEVQENVPLDSLRRCVFDLFLVGLWRLTPLLTAGGNQPHIELWFDSPEPPYYAQYRDQLPPVRFNMPANQLRFPAHLLEARLASADQNTAELVRAQCERELALLGDEKVAVGEQVLALLLTAGAPYLSLDQVAEQLRLSSRTLKRRLQQEGTSFLTLLDTTRGQEARRLLDDTTMTVAAIAEHLGYADPANFTRAFRKWTGQSPSHYRQRNE